MPHFPPKARSPSRPLRGHPPPDDEDSARAQRVRIKNRRKRYLDLHPDYFHEAHLELADPLLYDRLIRRFQSAAEREKEGRERGYSGVLEANLVRSEAKLHALEHPDPNSPLLYRRAQDGSITAVEQDEDNRPTGKEDGWEKWRDFVSLRFLRGDDADFDYAAVDQSELYDDREEEERRTLEKYLDGEEEEFVGDGRPAAQTGIQDF